MSTLPSSGFNRNLLSLNNLLNRFIEWLFLPSMVFASEAKWWGDKGRRAQNHEGIDIFAYRTVDGNISYLDSSTKIPVIYTGRVEKVIDDFLGKSVFVSHEYLNDENGRVFTLYGHTIPSPDIVPGTVVNEGDIIGTIADNGTGSVRPHLHISIARVPDTVSTEDLNWDTINSETINLIDPLKTLNMPFSILDSL